MLLGVRTFLRRDSNAHFRNRPHFHDGSSDAQIHISSAAGQQGDVQEHSYTDKTDGNGRGKIFVRAIQKILLNPSLSAPICLFNPCPQNHHLNLIDQLPYPYFVIGRLTFVTSHASVSTVPLSALSKPIVKRSADSLVVVGAASARTTSFADL
jgi:hypothetical protein